MLFPLIMLMMMLIVYDSDHFGDGVIDGENTNDDDDRSYQPPLSH